MKPAKFVTITLVMIVLFSTFIISYDAAFAQRKSSAIITIDEVPKKVRPGETVPLTGVVMTTAGEKLSNAPVSIILLTSDPRLIVVASGVTGLEGTYEIEWNVKLIPKERAFTDVTQQINTQVASLFARFEGNDNASASKTDKTTITIDVNSIKTFVNTDKRQYREGEAATVFIGFVDEDDEFVDPDSMNVNFNLNSIVSELEKKKVGSYTYLTPALKGGHNQITVVPNKAGFNIQAEAVTITVLPPITSGSFGFQ